MPDEERAKTLENRGFRWGDVPNHWANCLAATRRLLTTSRTSNLANPFYCSRKAIFEMTCRISPMPQKKKRLDWHQLRSKQMVQRMREADRIKKRSLLLAQRNNFLGSLRFNKFRKPVASLGLIVRQCMLAQAKHDNPQTPSVPRNDSEAFRLAERLQPEKWIAKPDLSYEAYPFLKSHGYGGSIDDLWLSLFGIKKLSRTNNPSADHRARLLPQAGAQRQTTDSSQKVGPKKKVSSPLPKYGSLRAGRPWVINTGQTRKPGSHRS